MNVKIIIPARFASTRFPGKPLIDILGVSLLKRVWERCIPVLGQEHVYVATDDDRIVQHCKDNGMQWLMTPSSCLTGTDRLASVVDQLNADLYINVQGDEPLIEPNDIQIVIDAALSSPDKIINAYCSIKSEDEYLSRTVPKVVFRPDGRLLYMSRAPIPGTKNSEFIAANKQVCIYAFPPESLKAFASNEAKTPLENLEDIEILRFLELGYEVKMIEVSGSSVAVDTPSDVEKVISILLKN